MKAALIAALKEKQDAQAFLVTDGRCENIEAYRRACGIIYGLKMAIDEIEETIKEETGKGFDE